MVYARPLFDDGYDVVDAERRETEIVPWMETDDVTSTLDRLRGQQGMGSRRGSGSGWWENGGVVVLKHHGGLVVLVDRTVRASVPRAEIAILVILGEIRWCGGLCLAQPRTLIAVRGDEDVNIGEGVVYDG